MKEQPNLDYLNSLSGGDPDFERELVKILKKEFPSERDIYYTNLRKSDFQETAQIVHKLKHKISILGLEKGYTLAAELEESLKNLTPNDILLKEFDALLELMDSFISGL